MPYLRSILGSAAFAAVVVASLPALADALPPDGCNRGAGTACSNAGPNADEPGVCTETPCGDGSGGAPTNCMTCEPIDGGQGTGGSAGTTPGKGGCAVSASDRGAPFALAGLLLALGALARPARRAGRSRRAARPPQMEATSAPW
jgi:hypothetical protein